MSLQPGLEWQRKKKIVLGFSVTRRSTNGFTLVRLLSSGEVESQGYSALWQTQKKMEECHGTCSPRFNHHLMRCDVSHMKYRLGRKLMYLELDCLRSYLLQALRSELRNRHEDELRSDGSLTHELHESLCRNRNPAMEMDDVTSGIRVPVSAHEVALMRMWASVPVGLLQLAFSCNPESTGKPVRSLGYLGVSDSRQLPLFLMRNPKKGHYSDALTGAVIPLPIARSVGKKSRRFCFEEYRLRSNEALKPTRQAMSSSEPVVHLSDDVDQTPEASSQIVQRKFVVHKPSACGNNKEELYGTMLSKAAEKDNNKKAGTCVGMEMFDSLCPIQMEFSGDATKFSTNELKIMRLFTTQFSMWQREFSSYQDFRSNSLS